MNNLRARADESLETRSSSAYRHVGARAAIRVHAARHGSVRIRAAYGLQAARWTDAPARTRPGCPIGDSGPAGQNLNFKSGTYVRLETLDSGRQSNAILIASKLFSSYVYGSNPYGSG